MSHTLPAGQVARVGHVGISVAGTVAAARPGLLDELETLKLLKSVQAVDASLRARFLRHALAKMELHGHLGSPVLAVEARGDLWVVATRWLQGTNLGHVLTPQAAGDYALQLCEALVHEALSGQQPFALGPVTSHAFRQGIPEPLAALLLPSLLGERPAPRDVVALDDALAPRGPKRFDKRVISSRGQLHGERLEPARSLWIPERAAIVIDAEAQSVPEPAPPLAKLAAAHLGAPVAPSSRKHTLPYGVGSPLQAFAVPASGPGPTTVSSHAVATSVPKRPAPQPRSNASAHKTVEFSRDAIDVVPKRWPGHWPRYAVAGSVCVLALAVVALLAHTVTREQQHPRLMSVVMPRPLESAKPAAADPVTAVLDPVAPAADSTVVPQRAERSVRQPARRTKTKPPATRAVTGSAGGTSLSKEPDVGF
ncbi:MAG: hypothetical protein ABW321_16595 [Polyangiales bacterium]